MFGVRLMGFATERFGPLFVWQWVGLVAGVLGGVLLGLLVSRVGAALIKRLVERTPSPLDDVVARACHRPLRLLCTLLATYLLWTLLRLPEHYARSLATLMRASAIACVTWAVMRSLNAVAHTIAGGGALRDTNDPEKLAHVRSLRTQVIVANRIISVIVFVVGCALVALQFEVVRSVGFSLLASAGVAGVVLGFAAQKSLGALLAGIQLSISQPIRIGDSVVLEGEYGVIEDIGLTYVAVRLWDDRRLIVPTPRFLEEPFQNWSRGAGLTGTVFLKVDVGLPLAVLRAEFERIIVDEPLWDGRVKALHLFDAGERVLEVRVIVSAQAPGSLFDLRASVREKLVTFLQNYEGGIYLPHTHIAMANGDMARTPSELSTGAHHPHQLA